ncbi:MAG: SDR family oxidoreductase [Planctomycetales bacterium]|nr:SDR family oxidoreductase [Planctomycetales bacterium]
MPADASTSLSGKVAVVTGSSSGIGRAIADQLAQAEAEVIVHGSHKFELAEQLVEELRAQGAVARALKGDFSQADERNRFVEHCWRLAPVDIWINNAGADVLTGQSAEWTFEQKLERLWEVDVSGTVQLSRSVGKLMQQRGSGVILNMGWDQAEHGMDGDSGEMFAAVKGAVMAFSRSLAKSLAPQVRVNCLAPGWIQTSWGQEASEYWQQRAAGEALLQRWGTPEDVARMARFLVSDEASFITGQVVQVNGGRI